MTNLNDIGKDNPFQVPDHYFEELDYAVLKRIRQSSAKSGKSLSVIIASVAAVGLLLLSIALFHSPETSDLVLTTPPQEMENPFFIDSSVIEKEYQEIEKLTDDKESDAVNKKSQSGKKENTVASKVFATIENREFDNLDYQIMEFYEDEITMLESYANY